MFTLRQTPVHEIMRGDFGDRMISPPGTTDECALVETQRKVQEWRDIGSFVIFNAGSFDILGLNHVRGLIQCRLLGAMSLHDIVETETAQQLKEAHDTAASDRIRLILSMDTDIALEEGKSRQPHKGNAPKPTLSWDTRAAMVALQAMPGVNYDESVSLVDYITRHGPGCCTTCAPGSCVNEDDARMAEALQPDMVVVGKSSLQTIADLTHSKKEGRLPHTELVAIDEMTGAFSDSVLGGIISTTAIVERIRS